VSALLELQREFQRHVLRPGRRMQRRVVSTPRAGAAVRLAVYANGYRARLAEVLGNDFEALRTLLGAPAFDTAARAFIAARPSKFANLRWYGGELAGFLSRSPRWRRRPVLAELAAFEWALGLAFDALDAETVSVEAVARLPAAAWPSMTLRLHPSVRLIALRSNAPDIWRAARDARPLPRASRRARPLAWLVWRKQLTPFYRALAADEAWALDAVSNGRSFGVLCDGLRRHVGDAFAAPRAAALLKGWLAEGLVCAID